MDWLFQFIEFGRERRIEWEEIWAERERALVRAVEKVEWEFEQRIKEVLKLKFLKRENIDAVLEGQEHWAKGKQSMLVCKHYLGDLSEDARGIIVSMIEGKKMRPGELEEQILWEIEQELTMRFAPLIDEAINECWASLLRRNQIPAEEELWARQSLRAIVNYIVGPIHDKAMSALRQLEEDSSDSQSKVRMVDFRRLRFAPPYPFERGFFE